MRGVAWGAIVQKRPPGLERGIARGSDCEHRPGAVKADNLYIACIESDLRVMKGVDGVRFLEGAAMQDVVEHHRDAKSTDLDRISGHVGQLEL